MKTIPKEIKLDWQYTKQQKQFIESTADEVLYGGAAGGGKSYCQVMDATIKAIQYPGITQVILRTTMPELERSIIRTAFKIIPKEIYGYNGQKHTMTFKNGSIIDFGYAANEQDVMQYQSSEYDIIRFDEATHFDPFVLNYLSSRVRGANNFPKQIKFSTNPGGKSHNYIKERFIDPAPAGKPFKVKGIDGDITTRLFIPAKVTDNVFLMKSDKKYISRLKQLGEGERKKLLDGSWDIYEGLFFPEFSRDIHVVSTATLHADMRRFVTIDYGLDMFAALFIAVGNDGEAFVYKEIYKPGLIISDAIKELKGRMHSGEKIERYLAPRDLWNRRQESGKNVADYFLDEGILLNIAPNRRIPGLLAIKEYLAPNLNIFGEHKPRLRIFEGCVNLIRCLTSIQTSPNDPEDISSTPHELTHAIDALRYFCAYQLGIDDLPEAKSDDDDYDSAISDSDTLSTDAMYSSIYGGSYSYDNGFDY